MIANTARPCRLSPTMWPKVKARASGMMMIDQTSTKLLIAVAFSNGCAEFMSKNPPPLVPSCLIATWLAAGPPGIAWRAPSSVCAVVKPWRFWITPWLTRMIATTNDIGSRIRVVLRVRSTQKLPSVVAWRRDRPRISAAMAAMPAAAETKFCTASPIIWVRWLIVASPE